MTVLYFQDSKIPMCKLACTQFLSNPHPNYIFIFLIKKIGTLATHTFSMGKGKISALDLTLQRELNVIIEFIFCGLLIIKNNIYICKCMCVEGREVKSEQILVR